MMMMERSVMLREEGDHDDGSGGDNSGFFHAYDVRDGGDCIDDSDDGW